MNKQTLITLLLQRGARELEPGRFVLPNQTRDDLVLRVGERGALHVNNSVSLSPRAFLAHYDNLVRGY